MLNKEPVHILLVEDEEGHAELISRAFESWSPVARLTMVSGLQEAWDRIEASKPDLIIADYRLPDGEGTDLILRENEDVLYPVVIMTSHGDEQLAVEAIKAGAIDYVVKSTVAFSEMPRIAERALREWGHIEKRRIAEAALRESENRLRTILDATQAGILVIETKTHKIIDVNPAALKMLDAPRNQIIGRVCYQFIRPSQEEAWLFTQRKNESEGMEKALLKPDGGEIPILKITSRVVLSGQDCLIVSFIDLTEKKALENQLMQFQKMEAIGTLAAGMAHEINNPLAGILQNAQVVAIRILGNLSGNRRVAEECGTTMEAIKTYMEKRDVLKMLNSITESGNRAAKIIDNMLSFSRRSESETAFYDLSNLIDKTVGLAQSEYDLKRKHDFRQIRIKREYDPNMPKVQCEGTKIQQVILNLLKNAAQAMSKCAQDTEPPTITLRTRKEEKMARIEIEDNGPGMEETTRQRIFEPFFTTKATQSGTGLGLSVSYFIVTENHGGTINVESVPGMGAKFIIRLPLEKKG
jgi:PAS domain S-box-containing protein